jgi:hypothetical protein
MNEWRNIGDILSVGSNYSTDNRDIVLLRQLAEIGSQVLRRIAKVLAVSSVLTVVLT